MYRKRKRKIQYVVRIYSSDTYRPKKKKKKKMRSMKTARSYVLDLAHPSGYVY